MHAPDFHFHLILTTPPVFRFDQWSHIGGKKRGTLEKVDAHKTSRTHCGGPGTETPIAKYQLLDLDAYTTKKREDVKLIWNP